MVHADPRSGKAAVLTISATEGSTCRPRDHPAAAGPIVSLLSRPVRETVRSTGRATMLISRHPGSLRWELSEAGSCPCRRERIEGA